MRLSQLFGKTQREIPTEAETLSHQLLLRSGMIHQVAAGVYSFLPLGWRALRKIEGIGPKIQVTLQAAGIDTFAQLAASKPEDLKQILVDAGIRLGDPTTWPEQAALAAAGNWDELKEFQGTLKGGRR